MVNICINVGHHEDSNGDYVTIRIRFHVILRILYEAFGLESLFLLISL